MPQCPKASRHSYSADPSRLFVVTCSHCGNSRDYRRKNKNHQVSKYLKYRRTKRRDLGLLNMGAPLDSDSASRLTRIAAGCGLVSSASGVPHVTFAEGLRPEEMTIATPSKLVAGGGLREAVEDLREALKSEPTLKVVRVHSVPRRDGSTNLIIADLDVERGVEDAVGHIIREESWCALPQFPFHVALGACARNDTAKKRAEATEAMMGTQLRIDAARVKVLAPSERREAKAGQGKGEGGGGGKQNKMKILRRGRGIPVDSKEEDTTVKKIIDTGINENADGVLPKEPSENFDAREESNIAATEEEETTASEDSTLPTVSPGGSDDEDEDDYDLLAVDLSFLDDAIPSPAAMRRPHKSPTNKQTMKGPEKASATYTEDPPSWQNPTGHGPVRTAAFVNVSVPRTVLPNPPPPPQGVGKEISNEDLKDNKEQQHKRGASKGRMLPSWVFGKKATQVAPVPPSSNNSTESIPTHQEGSSTLPNQQPQHPLPPHLFAQAPYDLDQPLYYHSTPMIPPAQLSHTHHPQQAQAPTQAQAGLPLATYDRHPVYNPEHLYHLYNQPVAPQPYPVENGYVTWVRTTPLTYEPLFVPNSGGGGGRRGGFSQTVHASRAC